MHKVRTTIQPDIELEVDDTEYVDLDRQGLLLKTSATTDKGARKSADRQATQEG